MKALKLAIQKTMTDDAEYLALMGVPTVHPYQTFYLKPPEKPTFPETVFNFQSVNYDTSIGRESLSADIRLNVTVWSVDDACEDIIKRIIILFHQKSIGVTGAHAIMLQEPQDMKDEDFNVYGKTISFAVTYRRSIYE